MFDVVVEAGDAGIWQQLVRPTLEECTVAALQRLASGTDTALNLALSDARLLRAFVGFPASMAPARRALPPCSGQNLRI